MAIAVPLLTSGRFIVDANGRRVRLAGVNWAGAEEDGMVAAGLDYRHRNDIAGQIAGWGFNSVRLLFAVRTVTYGGTIDPAQVRANPDLAGQTPWQVYQACAGALTAAGLIVIPDCHISWSGWCCSNSDGNGLWWNANWPESVFLGAWQKVAQAFAGNPLVAAYDLRNEPRQAVVGGVTYRPSWGDGNSKTDFRAMYQRAGNLILAIDPDPLIICEGLSYAGDLGGVAAYPVTLARPGKVVYSCHDYPWYHPSGQSRADYLASMRAKAGFVTEGARAAPLFVGEVGVSNASQAALGLAPPGSSSPDAGQAGWWQNFCAWARQLDVDWCYWHLAGTHVRAVEPQTNKLVYLDGDRCTSGLFAQDWQGPASPWLLGQLQALQAPAAGPGISGRG